MTRLNNRQETKFFRKKLRRNMTKSEVILWKQLYRKRIGFKFRRQHSIGAYIMDFYCPEVKLCVEVDGITHLDPEKGETDRQRETYIRAQGITIIRFSSEEVIRSTKSVVGHIYNLCKNLQEKNM